jgi:putative peptidoglycan lipid II flippase
MVANMAMNLILIGPLAHVGLALATSFSAFLNAGLLYRGLHKEGWMKHRSGWGLFVLALVMSVILMLGVVWSLTPDTQWWFDQSGWLRCLRLTGVVFAGLATFAVCLFAFGLRVSYLRAPSRH